MEPTTPDGTATSPCNAPSPGLAIRRARRHQGLTQVVLGERTGLRQETISLIENGNPATRMDTLLKVLAALDLEFQITPRTKTDPADIEALF